MAIVKLQKSVKSPQNPLLMVGGTASIIEITYRAKKTGGKNHSSQKTIESLGKVIRWNKETKEGIFLSKTRGLTGFNLPAFRFFEVNPCDPEIQPFLSANLLPERHTVFGDSYLLLKILEKSGFLSVFRKAFSDKKLRRRVIFHCFHTVLSDGSKITCDNFIEKSFLSYFLDGIAPASLKCDSDFFAAMGNDKVRMAFFNAYIDLMKKKVPEFGKGCYVDSTGLPNEISRLLSNAVSSHGGAAENQSRLALVLDELTGLPVWYALVPGNVLDLSTLTHVIEDVDASLGIKIGSLVLDAGYVSKELLSRWHEGSDRQLLVARMPARKGYPHAALYRAARPLMQNAKYDIRHEGHAYFGNSYRVEIFGFPLHAHVFVDYVTALCAYQDFMDKEPEEFEKMTDKEKTWRRVKGGFFVLLTNREMDCKEVLDLYFKRIQIESVFKDAKNYEGLLPLKKWSREAVLGKILLDIISTLLLLEMRKESAKDDKSPSEIIGKTQSLMCILNPKDKRVVVEAPSRQVKSYYGAYGLEVPAQVKLPEAEKEFFD